MATLVAGYKKQLGELRAELTKAGDIDGAVAAQAEFDRAEGDTTKPADRTSGIEIDLGEILRTRQWRRLKKDGASADFTFNGDGTIVAKPASATSWRRWRASGNALYLTTDDSKEWVFELASEKRPYSLEAVTPTVTHLRFVELD